MAPPTPFLHREQERADLDHITRRERPCLVIVYGVMNRLHAIDTREQTKSKRPAETRGKPLRSDDRSRPAWTCHLAVFVRRGVTATVKEAARTVKAQVIPFKTRVADLERLPEKPSR